MKEKTLSEKIEEIREKLYSYSAEICLNEIECDIKEAIKRAKEKLNLTDEDLVEIFGNRLL